VVDFLRRFRRTTEAASDKAVALPAHDIAMHWRAGTSMPIPDWDALWNAAPGTAEAPALHKYSLQAAQAWLHALKTHLGASYATSASEHFLLLSPLPSRSANLTLQACERMRHRILRALPDIASTQGYGPHVVLVFDTHDAYYAYIDNYYTEPGEYAYSSGMFLQYGYGHFVFAMDQLATMEPIIAHELTHCLVAHLSLPAWLNEGTAVGMEKRLCPRDADPRDAAFALRERTAKRTAFWNEATIQQFWSGKSFMRPDEGNMLSYELGEDLTRLLSRDYDRFAAFANAVRREDAGAAAASGCLGIELGDAAAAILGDGDWQPRPECWHEGLERGQF